MSVPLELFPVFLTQVRLPLKNSNVESGVVSPAFRLVQACHYGFFFLPSQEDSLGAAG